MMKDFLDVTMACGDGQQTLIFLRENIVCEDINLQNIKKLNFIVISVITNLLDNSI